MTDQDWQVVVIRKRAPPAAKKAPPKKSDAVKAAVKSGAPVSTLKKANAGTNKKPSSLQSNKLRALEDPNNEENLSHARLDHSVSVRIQQARNAKGWTQKELAQHLNEKPAVVAEYENGSCIPNMQLVHKMERVLGVKLTGKA
ncbi:multiprotein-bridging factor 1b [Pelomyxa schiedti]|nr:multiprotein-bridging factor 1b [Pelomyxa schiedti]